MDLELLYDVSKLLCFLLFETIAQYSQSTHGSAIKLPEGILNRYVVCVLSNQGICQTVWLGHLPSKEKGIMNVADYYQRADKYEGENENL